MPATGPIDHATKLYELSPTPILYVGPYDLMLGRVPLFPLFLKANATPTIPHQLRDLKGSAFQFGTADAAVADGRGGSNVFRGCGSMGAGGLALGACPCLRP